MLKQRLERSCRSNATRLGCAPVLHHLRSARAGADAGEHWQVGCFGARDHRVRGVGPSRHTQHANNGSKPTTGDSKPDLRPMRGLKRDPTASLVIRRLAFIQNLDGPSRTRCHVPPRPHSCRSVRRTRPSNRNPTSTLAPAPQSINTTSAAWEPSRCSPGGEQGR